MEKITPEKRIAKFLSSAEHAWYRKIYARLSKTDVQTGIRIITEIGFTTPADFEYRVNRVFLDREKPRRYLELLELLTFTTRS